MKDLKKPVEVLNIAAIYKILYRTLENTYLSQAYMSNSKNKPQMRSQSRSHQIMKKQDVERVHYVMQLVFQQKNTHTYIHIYAYVGRKYFQKTKQETYSISSCGEEDWNLGLEFSSDICVFFHFFLPSVCLTY